MKRELLVGVPRVLDLVRRRHARAQAGHPEPAIAVGRHGRRPEARRALRVVGLQLMLEIQLRDADDHPRGGLALHVDQPALDGRLGRQRDRRLLPLGVGLEVDHREGPPGRGGDQGQAIEATRGDRRDIHREPALGISRGGAREDVAMPAVAVADHRLPVGQRRDAGAGDRLALRVEHAAGDGHPARGNVARSCRGRRSRCGRWTLHLRFIAHHERAGEPAGAGGDDGQKQQGERRESQLVPEHGLQDLLGQCRGGRRERPAGGVTGREGDRGPGRGFTQEG